MTKSDKSFPIEMLELIQKQKGFAKFRDEKGKPWIELEDDNAMKIFACDSSIFEGWCRKLIYKEFGINPGQEALKNIINLIKAEAQWGPWEYKLHNRTAFFENYLVYDLSNEGWEKVSISDDGWKVLKKEPMPIFFKRYTHQNKQVTPEKEVAPEYAKKLLEYVNIVDEDQKILFLVWLISCFIPDFPHPLLYIYGPQGSAKSTILRIARELADPSLLELGSLPKNPETLIQQLDHNWINCFDNVSYIDQPMSDLLCKVITGIGVSKRELYTNDEDIIYNFMRCIAINGINIEGAQPDLLERSILLNLKRMDDSKRMPEDTLWKSFREEKPKILGAIFSTLSHAISVKNDLELIELPRMADFMLWGCAIADGLGYDFEKFYDAYMRNINSQTEESINSSAVAVTIREFMNKRARWEGTPRDLHRALEKETSNDFGFSDIGLPKDEVVLSKKLGQLEVVLGKIGIIIERERGEKRIIRLINTKFKNPVVSPDGSDSKNQTLNI